MHRIVGLVSCCAASTACYVAELGIRPELELGSAGSSTGEAMASAWTPLGSSDHGRDEGTPATDGSVATGCIDGDLGSALGDALVRASTEAAGDDIDLDCWFADDGRDRAYRWQAPDTATYAFAIGGGSDTVLVGLAVDDCGEQTLDCRSPAHFAGPVITRDMLAGEQVLVVVDGAGAGEFPFTLGIREALDSSACLDADLADATGTAVGEFDLQHAADNHVASCGLPEMPDVVVLWTAPTDGDYTFSVAGAELAAAISARGSCGDEELACAFDVGGAAPSITLSMLAGASIVLVVDAQTRAATSVRLDVTPLG